MIIFGYSLTDPQMRNAKTCTVMIRFEREVAVRMLYDMYRSALPRGDINIGPSAEQPPRNVRQI